MKQIKKLFFAALAMVVLLSVPSVANAQSMASTDKGIMEVPGTKASVEQGKNKYIPVTVKPLIKREYKLKAGRNNSNVSLSWAAWNGCTRKLIIKGEKVGTSVVTLYTTYNSSKIRINVTVKYPASKVVKRALIIGESDYPGTNNDLPGCKNDALAMSRILPKAGYHQVNAQLNQSKSQVTAQIKNTFKDADDNDISFFYYSGHGLSDGITSDYHGALCTTDGSFYKLNDLAALLKQVPGTVIVAMDSCFSGQAIGKSADGTVKAIDLKNFNDDVIDAFASAEGKTKAAFTSSKFKVITACSRTQTSAETWYTNNPSFHFGAFTVALVDGAGFNYATGAKFASAPADTNGDNSVTINECYKYVNAWTDEVGFSQNCQVYPTSCGTPLFKR